jgi:Tol biopolymer transport system component
MIRVRRTRSILGIVIVASLTATLCVACGSRAAHLSLTAPFRWSDQFEAWSPNGRLILFSSDRPAHKQWDLYVMNVDGSHLRRLTDDKLRENNPRFLSNRTIGFTVRGKRWVIGADGRGRKRLFRHAHGTHRHAARRSGSSPNGRWIAFGRHRPNGPRDWYGDTAVDVYVMRSDGSDKRRVATVGPATHFSPEWSPNSRAFTFEAPPNGGNAVISQGTTISEIYIVHLGRKATQLSHSPGSCCALWSPNGNEIAFVSPGSPTDYSDLTLTKPDGSNQHTLGSASGGLDVSTMTWVLAGRRLIITSGTGEYLVNADGTQFRQLLSAPNNDVFPSRDQTKAVINELGGPEVSCDGCWLSVPAYRRIDIVDLNSGRIQPLTQR